MITKEFLKLLSLMTPITDKAIIKSPITTLNSESVDILVNVKTDFEVENPICIFELSKFLNLLNLFENYDLSIESNKIIVSNTQTKSVFTLGSIDVMEDFNKSSEIIDRIDLAETVSKFTLKAKDMIDFKKSANIFSELNTIDFIGKDTSTYVELGVYNKYNSSNNTFSKEYLSSAQKQFKVSINIDSFLKLPNCDYEVCVKYNESKNAYRILFKTELFTIAVSTINV